MFLFTSAIKLSAFEKLVLTVYTKWWSAALMATVIFTIWVVLIIPRWSYINNKYILIVLEIIEENSKLDICIKILQTCRYLGLMYILYYIVTKYVKMCKIKYSIYIII